jgi:hypothetical protein
VAWGVGSGSVNVWVEVAGRKRTERITTKDLEVLEFVARYGVVPREVVAMWAKTGRAVTAARERRLREAGLVEVLPGVGDSGRLCLCTRRGLGAVGREDLPTPSFSPATLRHSATAARVGVQLERAGHRVLSEREIEARERAEGRRVFSAECRNGRLHRPDLVLLGERPEAVEVELTAKSAHRLDEILRAWRRSVGRGQFAGVRYLCSAGTLPYVNRAARRVRTEDVIEVESLRDADNLHRAVAEGPALPGLARG